MDITLKEKDIKAMPNELRDELLRFMSERLTSSDSAIAADSKESESDNLDRLNMIYPSVIPIEAACAVLAGLNSNSRNVFEAILNSNNEQDKKKSGLSRAEISDITGVKIGSINGTIGSINRRFLHRFDRRIYDFELEQHATNLIHYSEETSKYIFTKTRLSLLNFQIAILILESGHFFDSADIELIFPNEFGVKNTPPDINEIEQILDNQPRVRLSADSFLNFNNGNGLTDFYQNHPDLEYTNDAELFINPIRKKWWALKNADLPVTACCDNHCHSVQLLENGFSITTIGPAAFIGPSNKKVEVSQMKTEFTCKDFSVEKIRVRTIY